MKHKPDKKLTWTELFCANSLLLSRDIHADHLMEAAAPGASTYF